MLGLGRALGETMAVTFVIGNAHRISASILQPGTTISASLANEFTEAFGDLYRSSLIALGFHPVHHHLHRAGDRQDACCCGCKSRRGAEPMTPYARRRLVNAVVMAPVGRRDRLWPACGSCWCLWTLLVERHLGDHPGAVQPDDAAARQQRRPAERDLRQRRDDRDRDPDRHADRHPRRHLSRRIQPRQPLWRGRALYQRHPVERAVDHRRTVRLRDHGRADGPFLGLGRVRSRWRSSSSRSWCARPRTC